MKSEDLDSYSKPLIGLNLVSVEKKDHSWFFAFGEGDSIVTEGPWRLVSEERIAVTSEDQGQQFGLPKPVNAAERALSCLTGRTVTGTGITEFSGDLTVEFSGRVLLQFLQISCGYESWRLHIRGSETICTGGGDIAHFPAGQAT